MVPDEVGVAFSGNRFRGYSEMASRGSFDPVWLIARKTRGRGCPGEVKARLCKKD